MNLAKYPLKLLDGLADRIFAVLGALLLSQFPAFTQHYIQRLSGHVAEARNNVAGWQTIADHMAGGSIERMLQMPHGTSGTFGKEAARKCASDVARLNRLQQRLHAIRNSPAWRRMFVFLRHLDWEVAQGTMKDFVPNVPLDAESLTYAAAGLVLAVVTYHLLKLLVRALFRTVRTRLSRTRETAECETA